jgi:tRNA-Thr(GGU) m(6)t(6)A37 methyltransferase TsaA
MSGPDVRPIGVVRNSVAQPRDEGWGAVVSEIRLRPELADGLRGLADFSHAVVVFLLDRAGFDPTAHLLRHPRNRPDLPRLGIFAQRGRNRPNGIGVTTVAIERVEDGVLTVRGLDAIDGTPVLDVKPHVPVYDAPARPRVPAWMDRLMQGYF